MAIITSKTCVKIDDTWELWIVNSGPHAEVVLSFTEGTDQPVRERITIHLSQAKACKIARALAGLTYVPPSGWDEENDEDTNPG